MLFPGWQDLYLGWGCTEPRGNLPRSLFLVPLLQVWENQQGLRQSWDMKKDWATFLPEHMVEPVIKNVRPRRDLRSASFSRRRRGLPQETHCSHTSCPPRKQSQGHWQKHLHQLLLQSAGWFFNVQICYEFIECFDSKFTMCIFNGSKFG